MGCYQHLARRTLTLSHLPEGEGMGMRVANYIIGDNRKILIA